MANENIVPDIIDEKEFDEAVEKAKDAPSLVTVKFGKPVSYNGKDYTELSFDFESLTGRDALNIDADLAMAGKITLMKETNEHYLVRFAACACVAALVLLFCGKPCAAVALRNDSMRTAKSCDFCGKFANFFC